ncbi:MAG TPA: toluene-4-monooxygenase system B family protein [Polyangiaceae bacterium]|jgi:hypothetical protein|nr:toluene-4-monooxygenase system B family protein [Polyangiaceae bacterium]
MTPLYGFLEGDTIGLLILAREDDTLAELGRKLQNSASVRVAPVARFKIVHHGRTLDPRATVRQVGMRALDRFDVLEEEEVR